MSKFCWLPLDPWSCFMPQSPGKFWLCVCVCVCVSHSVMSNSFATPWTVAYQASLAHGFSRQEYWSGLPFPSRGSSRRRDRTQVSSIGRQTLYHLHHQGSLVWVRIGELNCPARGFPGGSMVKNSPVSAEDTSSVPDPGRSYMLQGS